MSYIPIIEKNAKIFYQVYYGYVHHTSMVYLCIIFMYIRSTKYMSYTHHRKKREKNVTTKYITGLSYEYDIYNTYTEHQVHIIYLYRKKRAGAEHASTAPQC